MIYVHVLEYTFYHKMLMLYFVEEKWIAICPWIHIKTLWHALKSLYFKEIRFL